MIRKTVKPPSLAHKLELAHKLKQAKGRKRLKEMRTRSKLGKLVSERQRSETKGKPMPIESNHQPNKVL